MSWKKVVSIDELNRNKRALFKEGSKQIVVFSYSHEIYALDNRCPHQGYPLYEGSLDSDRVLTCHWHNWKFDLKSGKCISGGDSVRTYPTKREDGFIWVNLSSPSKEEIQKQILEGLKIAFDDRKYGRLSREIAKLYFNGIDPVTSLQKAIEWSYEKLKEGMGEGYCAASDWLLLYSQESGNFENQLICLMEAVDGISHEVFRKGVTLSLPVILSAKREGSHFSPTEFLGAIEKEDEAQAIAQFSFAFDHGLVFSDLEETLYLAALAHNYEGGKALIGLQKIDIFCKHFGDEIVRPLLYAFVRSLCHLRREELNPTFSHPKAGVSHPEAQPKDLFQQLLQGIVKNILYFDLGYQFSSDKPVSQNVDLLDVSGTLAVADAVFVTCQKYPKFSMKALEQLSYFFQKYTSFCDASLNASEWNVSDEDQFWKESLEKVLDHGIA
ncbi:MAG: Rieske (2Fe-2S) protein, partial [Deltaproteobacteria bacterium]